MAIYTYSASSPYIHIKHPPHISTTVTNRIEDIIRQPWATLAEMKDNESLQKAGQEENNSIVKRVMFGRWRGRRLVFIWPFNRWRKQRIAKNSYCACYKPRSVIIMALLRSEVSPRMTLKTITQEIRNCVARLWLDARHTVARLWLDVRHTEQDR